MRFRDRLKDLFIPCTENGFKPNFLERISVGIMLILVLLSFALANVQALLWIGSDWLVSTILPAVIVDLTNEERSTGSLGTLKRNDVLDAAAQQKANDMALKGYFAHYSPDGVSPWYWFDQVSYDFVHAGENLAVHFTDSQDVIDAWMKSPGHRANIMNGDFTEIGIGTARGEYKGYPTVFVVQLFGTPRARASQVAGATTNTPPIPVVEPALTVETVAQPTETQPGTDIAPATLETVPVIEVAETDEYLANTTTESTPTEEPVVSVDANENGDVVLYSDLATASRPGVPLTTEVSDGGGDAGAPETNVLLRGATQPSLWLQVVYSLLAFIVTIALILSIVIEWRRQHPVQIAYAAGLLVLMLLLLHVHVTLTSGVTIV